MVPLKGIEKTHPRMAHSCIHQLVDSRHRERVLWAGFIQVCKVCTYAPFPSLHFYHYCISQPFRVEDFFNNPSLLELRHLVFDSIRVFLRWMSKRLLLRGDWWIDIQMMTYEACIHSRGLVGVPGKYINVLLKEFHQLPLFLRWQLSTNLEKLLWIIIYSKSLQIFTCSLLG